MSRAYRIKVRESIRRVVRGSDHVSTSLEFLELLPCEQMAALVAAELESRGFEAEGEVMVRRQEGVVVSINPATGEVNVSAEVSEEVKLEKTGTGYGDEDWGRRSRDAAEEQLRERTRKELEKQADSEEKRLNSKATETLEQALRDLQEELDGVVSKVTAAALKQKAAQIGEIKSLTEDADAGTMTIVLEV